MHCSRTGDRAPPSLEERKNWEIRILVRFLLLYFCFSTASLLLYISAQLPKKEKETKIGFKFPIKRKRNGKKRESYPVAVVLQHPSPWYTGLTILRLEGPTDGFIVPEGTRWWLLSVSLQEPDQVPQPNLLSNRLVNTVGHQKPVVDRKTTEQTQSL